jgi:hypothetical protein
MSEENQPAPDGPGAEPPKSEQTARSAAWTVFVTFMGLLGTASGLKSFANSLVHQQWASWLLLAVGVIVLFYAFVLIYRLRMLVRNMGSERRWQLSATVLVGVLAVVVLAGGALSVISVRDIVSAKGATTGTFAYPAVDATSVPSPKTITATGTVQRLQSGHHLLVFLQFGSQQVYWAGDPDVVINTQSGHWSGTVCVGDPGDITLYLVDMGPEGLAALKNPATNYWGNGVPFLPSALGPDVSILNQVSFTAARAGTKCTAHEPDYY